MTSGRLDRATTPVDAAHEHRQLVAIIAILALVPLALYADIVFGGQSFAPRDHQLLTIPAHDFIRRALLGGTLPEWWEPATFGFPFACNPATQGLSPIAWLFALLPQPFGADVEPVFYIAVLGIGTALLARRLGATGVLGPVLAGILAECSGYVASLITNGAMPYIAWVPWMAWSADRLAGSEDRNAQLRAAAVFALVVALQVIAGEPGTVVTSGMLALAMLVLRSGPRRRSVLAWAVAAGILGVLLSAFSAIPAAVFGRGSERAGGLSFEDAALWSLHPMRLIELLWPHILGDPMSRLQYLALPDATGGRDMGVGPTWSSSVFIGLPAVLLAIRAGAKRRLWPLLACAGVFILLALGAHTPLFSAFRLVFPPERYLRYPEKHVIGAFVIVWALAGVGLGRIAEGRRALWSLVGATVALALVLGVTALQFDAAAAAIAGYTANLQFSPDIAGALRHSLAAGAIAAAAIAVAAFGVRMAASRPRLGMAVLAIAAVATTAADTRSLTVTIPRHHAPPAVVEWLPPGTRMYRNPNTDWLGGSAEAYIEAGYQTLDGEIPSEFGISSVPGYWLPLTRDLKYFWDRVLPLLQPKAFARAFGVSWAMLSDSTPEWGLTKDVVATYSGHPLARIPDVRPRAFVTSGWFPARDTNSALDALAARGRDLRMVTIENAPPAPERPVDARPCEADVSRINHAEMVCDSPGGYAVLLDQFAPGWTATVDEAPAEIVRADGLVRGVAVTPGVHRIAFHYRTPGLSIGMAVSACAAAALGIALYVSRRRRSGTRAASVREAA